MTSPKVVALLSAPSAEAPGAGGPAVRIVPFDQPILQALDLGATRGDGVFETISINAGRAQALEPHLERLARSAAMLELPAPDLDAWRQAVLAVIEELESTDESFAKLVYTRGVEGGDVPTGWVFAEPSADFTRARAEGIRVVTLDRGYPADIPSTAPWLLQGAKTLSYALNRAAVREAHRRDADDVLFVSSDGVLLEGPTSSLLLRTGDVLSTPETSLGILAGTTQVDAFRFAESRGLETRYERLGVDALESADALWLVSSVRHAAPVRAVNGVERRIDATFTSELNAFLVGRRD